jgi:hypothetical protein
MIEVHGHYYRENTIRLNKFVSDAKRRGYNHTSIPLIVFRGEIKNITTSPGYRARVDTRIRIIVIRWKGRHAGLLSEQMLDSLCPLYDEEENENYCL